jgi:hypothetical protein
MKKHLQKLSGLPGVDLYHSGWPLDMPFQSGKKVKSRSVAISHMLC